MRLTSAAFLTLVLVLFASPGGDASSSTRANGQIAYDRADPRSPGDTFVYTTNPDGNRTRRLMARHTCCPSWSHDGRKLAVPAALKGDRLTTATVDADGRHYSLLPIKDPALSVACAGGAWSPDDRQLACEGWDDTDPDRNGIYIRSSAGGDRVKRLTSNPGGGDADGTGPMQVTHDGRSDDPTWGSQ